MTRKLFLAACIAGLIISGCAKKSNEPVPRITELQGKVALELRKPESDGSPVFLKLKQGHHITPENFLVTKDGSVTLQFPTGDIVKVDNNSKIEILNSKNPEGGYDVTVNIIFGRVYADIDGLEKDGNHFFMNTPQGKSTPQGTIFIIETDKKGENTSVMVLSGKVALADTAKGSKKNVETGEMLNLDKSRGFSSSQKISTGKMNELKQWLGNETVERALAEGRKELKQERENNSPEITSEPVLFAEPGSPYLYKVIAEDQENDELTFSLIEGPEGMQIDPLSGELKWDVPDTKDVQVKISVEDNWGAAGEQEFVIKISQSLVAEFEVDPKKGPHNTQFKFSAAKSYSKIKGELLFRWDFEGDGKFDLPGNGEFGKDTTPVFSFNKAGVYSSTLEVKDAESRVVSVSHRITVNDPPVAILKIMPESGPIEKPFKFDAGESNDPENSTNELFVRFDFEGDGIWDFPGGDKFSKTKIAYHKYAKYGAYSPLLEVKDLGGEIMQIKLSIMVGPEPAVQAGPDTSLGINQELIFNGTVTMSDPKEKIFKYTWDFDGDGIVDYENAKSPKKGFAYDSIGQYNAVLTAYSSMMVPGRDTIKVKVIDFPLIAMAGADIEAKIHHEAKFKGTAEDKDGKITKYQWDFNGDGAYDFASPSSGEASFVYHHAGLYKAVLRVENSLGKSSFDTCIAKITNSPPQALAGEDLISKKGRKIELLGKGKDAEGEIIKYQWDFDADGSFDWEGQKPQMVEHKFFEFGNAVLKVTDDDGLTALDTIRIIICPEDMKLIKEEKFCIDMLEWPNKKGKKPLLEVSFDQSERYCKDAKKRICTVREWIKACATQKDNAYPYGNDFIHDACNTYGVKKEVSPAGAFGKCTTKDDVMDMSGNAMEWARDPMSKGDQALMGGSWYNKASESDCTARINHAPDKHFLFSGFRCCK